MSRLHGPYPIRPGVLVCASLAFLGCVSPTADGPDPDAIRIGTVLPFSGERGASGVPLEAALRLAVDDVNAAGGLAGRPLWLDVADSHSDDARGTQNALAMIGAGRVPFFVGTEEPKIAYQITSAIKANRMVHLMPGLTSAQFHDPSASAAWFRLSPFVSYLSCSLAKQMLVDGLKKAVVVSDSDDYSNTFAVRFGAVMRTKSNTATPVIRIDGNTFSPSEVFASIMSISPEAVVLMTSPLVAAKFLQVWAVQGRHIRVYLGPTLKDPVLLRNVPASVLEGLTGVSADLGEDEPAFAAYYANRTHGVPVTGSYYYFDAVALLSLALAEGIAKDGAIPAPSAVKAHLLNVASDGGSLVTFDTLADGLARLAAGQKISYKGAAGAYVLSSLGDSIWNRAAIWKIVDDDFVTVRSEQCDRSDMDNFDGLDSI